MGAYQLGTGVTITEFVTIDGTLIDPTVATFNVEAPDATVVSYTFGVDGEVTHPSTGIYVLDLAPAQVGQAGQWHYDFVGTGAVKVTSAGEFFMLPSSVDPEAVPGPPILGPCEAWCDSQEVMAYAGYPASVDLTRYAVEASMVLYELSARQFTGACKRIVRPCGLDACGAWYGYADIDGQLFWLGSWWGVPMPQGDFGGDMLCGCTPLSRVRLSGYPVWAIDEVLIDGEVVDPDGYRLDEWQYLTRVRTDADEQQVFWPGCQAMDLPATQPGTFQVTYRCGVSPPPLGAAAAAQLAAQLYFAIPGNGECQLPQGATKITRQNVTIERSLFANWGRNEKTGAWTTGLTLVDAFLNAYNPAGLLRRPAVYSPDRQPYARQVGSTPGGS